MFEPDGRGPSAARLLLTGICFVVIAAVAATAMIANSRGVFRKSVTVVAVMANVGDGLPPKSDVKYEGVRVGFVTEVTAAAQAGMNEVHIRLGPEYARHIPGTVTARVVPSNVFAVPSIQLLDNGSAPSLSSGTRIAQDRSLATVRLQTSLDQLRQIVAAVGRQGTDRAVGMLATLATATDGRGAALGDAGAQLRQIVEALRSVVSVSDAPTTLDALSASLRELQTAAPELLDALHHSVVPMLTIAQQREQLTALLTGGLHTTGTVEGALDRRVDQIINVTTHMGPVLDVLGDGAATFPQITVSVSRLTRNFVSVWNPDTQRITAKVIVQLTPNRQYTRADCPRYGDLAGPSCVTGPTSAEATAGSVDPRGFQPPAGLGPDIGPVGSPQEQQQIAGILGGPPNAASDLLFGPLARGTTVAVAPDPNGGER
ncbi:MlaD family protein [Nocardia sp. alder85J]|uniref:MlaD family protein n=1 Tax=Nocardia sp. alder85J TaxID=2862949 RepID=UPI001CD3E737|nr:MCE family protein [Nocardia sp. alder85J]MCX4095213.1 MCE family protein [Nocardia sp. alder85J]